MKERAEELEGYVYTKDICLLILSVAEDISIAKVGDGKAKALAFGLSLQRNCADVPAYWEFLRAYWERFATDCAGIKKKYQGFP